MNEKLTLQLTQSQFDKYFQGAYVELMDILDQRERRVHLQEKLLARYRKPLLCYSMNIAGPIKNNPLIRFGFEAGLEDLHDILTMEKITVLHEEVICESTGNEAYLVVDTSPLHLKELVCELEDGSSLGRLYDMDVLYIQESGFQENLSAERIMSEESSSETSSSEVNSFEAHSSGAHSSEANPSGANSSGAHSSGAHSSGAHSSEANSSGAHSSEAHSSGAKYAATSLSTCKIDRGQLGLPERSCLICGKPGRDCASRRIHSVGELQEKTCHILIESLITRKASQIAEYATRALLYEVNTTPKPGLVDRINNGSHRDMDIYTFMNSTASLWPYFHACAMAGMQAALREQSPKELFASLRPLGKQAESRMLRATTGVNTHKGAIFTLGILCVAAGNELLGTELVAHEPLGTESLVHTGPSTNTRPESNIFNNPIQPSGDAVINESGRIHNILQQAAAMTAGLVSEDLNPLNVEQTEGGASGQSLASKHGITFGQCPASRPGSTSGQGLASKHGITSGQRPASRPGSTSGQGLASRQGITSGQRLYAEHGITGVRGEMEAGLPAVSRYGLPLLKQLLSEGCTPDLAGSLVLLTLIAHSVDTNLIHRSSIARQQQAAREAQALLEKVMQLRGNKPHMVHSMAALLNGKDPNVNADFQAMALLAQLDQEYIRENLSPGGSADLLAACWLLHFLDADAGVVHGNAQAPDGAK